MRTNDVRDIWDRGRAQTCWIIVYKNSVKGIVTAGSTKFAWGTELGAASAARRMIKNTVCRSAFSLKRPPLPQNLLLNTVDRIYDELIASGDLAIVSVWNLLQQN